MFKANIIVAIAIDTTLAVAVNGFFVAEAVTAF